MPSDDNKVPEEYFTFYFIFNDAVQIHDVLLRVCMIEKNGEYKEIRVKFTDPVPWSNISAMVEISLLKSKTRKQ